MSAAASQTSNSSNSACWYVNCNNTSPTTPMRCSICKEAMYCGPACQKADWKLSHKKFCTFPLVMGTSNRRDSSNWNLNKARELAAREKIIEALSFMTCMTSKDQTTLLEEMKIMPKFQTEDVAAILFVGQNRQAEAVEIMKNLGHTEEEALRILKTPRALPLPNFSSIPDDLKTQGVNAPGNPGTYALIDKLFSEAMLAALRDGH